MKTLITLLLGSLLGTSAAATPFIETLQNELDNRYVAGLVVPQLAEHHQGSPQGQFWARYAELERLQAPRYAAAADALQLQPRQWRSQAKARLSLQLARLFPAFFLNRLAVATRSYLEQMHGSQRPLEPELAALLDYMLKQESRQVEALAEAASGRFEVASGILERFNAQLSGPP